MKHANLCIMFSVQNIKTVCIYTAFFSGRKGQNILYFRRPSCHSMRKNKKFTYCGYKVRTARHRELNA